MARKNHPTAMMIIGVTVPNIKTVLKQLKTTIKDWNAPKKINLCIQLVNMHILECQHIAYELIGNDKQVLQGLTPTNVKQLAKNLDNWVSVDTYSVCVLGKAWREHTIPTDYLIALTRSDDVWKRRTAVVSTVSLNLTSQGGYGDADRTLKICELLVEDHADMVVKAMSWALRELSKKKYKETVHFLNKHKRKLHKKVVRELENKLTKGTKN
jgi:3-methyladenine DNA glycosylase AlkD